MTATPTRPVAPDPAPGVGTRFVRSPWLWGPLGLALTFAVSTGAAILAGQVGAGWNEIVFASGIVVVLLVYVVLMRGVAGRRPEELTGAGGSREVLLGAGLGAGFVTVCALVVAALGGYDIRWVGGDIASILLPIVLFGVSAGVVEELMFRGFGLQALERIAGSWVALAVTAVAFGAVHLSNDGATPWSATAITLKAGLLLGAAFLWRRDLRFVIGVHLAWNITQGVLGISVSGGAQTGLWETVAQGPDLLSGGEFGLEASLVPVLLSLVPTSLMLIAAHRRGNLRPPSWHHGPANP